MSAAKRPKLTGAMEEEMNFAIKHEFRNILDIRDDDVTLNGQEETHYGIPWRISGEIHGDGWDVYLECRYPRDSDDWSIETAITCEGFKGQWKFSKTENMKHMFSYDLEPNNNNLSVEMTVKINKINGNFGLKKDRSFNESNKKYSDVVLKVKNEKFYVSKLSLAHHSTYFENLFLGNSDEAKQSEVELKEDIDPWDFQNYLELIHGETLINDWTVAGILRLADLFVSKTAIKRCVEFFQNTSEKSLKFKFDVAIKYKLDELKKTCIAELETKDDVRAFVSENREHFDIAIWAEMYDKLDAFS